jgi:hypothetical protein
VTAPELVDWAIERIERLNPRINAVVTTIYERARKQAREIPRGPFAGVPYLLKDMIVEVEVEVEGVPLNAGSAFLRGNVSTHSAELVRRLEAAGLIILGSPRLGARCAGRPALGRLRARGAGAPGRPSGRTSTNRGHRAHPRCAAAH